MCCSTGGCILNIGQKIVTANILNFNRNFTNLKLVRSSAQTTNHLLRETLTMSSNSSTMSTMFSSLSLAEQAVTQRGGKFCTLSSNGSKVTLFPTSEAIVAAFPPGNFDKDATATRQTLELRCNPQLIKHFDQFDEWAKQYLFEHSERLFGKAHTQLQIQECYHPTIKRHATGAYPPTLRTKINTKGRGEITYWTPDGVKREAPEDWSLVSLVPHLEISNLWIMSRELGWVIQCTALKVYEESAACPFAADESALESSPW